MKNVTIAPGLPYTKEWEEYALIAYDDEKNAMFCSSTFLIVGVGKTIVTRGNNAFATDEAGLVKSLAD